MCLCTIYVVMAIVLIFCADLENLEVYFNGKKYFDNYCHCSKYVDPFSLGEWGNGLHTLTWRKQNKAKGSFNNKYLQHSLRLDNSFFPFGGIGFYKSMRGRVGYERFSGCYCQYPFTTMKLLRKKDQRQNAAEVCSSVIHIKY